MVDMGYLIRLPHIVDVKTGVEAAWVGKADLGHYDMPDDVRVFLRHHL
jgi:hypothetical protein